MNYNVDEIAQMIAECQEHKKLPEQYIRELRYSPVVDAEGNIVSYADLEA
ncbi:MAG: hypothetical protein LRZ84_16305 [Desertifilum sp.]|nr:hypothetical protein [Desertifilum sp.]